MVRLDTPNGDTIAIPNWLWGSIGALLLLTVGGIGTWAGATLTEHSGQLATHTEAIATLKENGKSCNDKLDRIYEALRSR